MFCNYLIGQCLLLVLLLPATAAHAEPPEAMTAFLNRNCSDCHGNGNSEGGFAFSELPAGFSEAADFSRWIRVFDRVASGEMPPPEHQPPAASAQAAFLQQTKNWLQEHQQQLWNEQGRVHGRRLTNLQLERTLHDLLGIDIPLAAQMPEEPRNSLFTSDADSQPMSHFQLQQHLQIVDTALQEAFRRALTTEQSVVRDLGPEQIVRQNPIRRTREPELLDGLAVTWSSRLIFYGRLPCTTAPEDGWYRFRIRAKALQPPATGGVWCTVNSGRCVSSAPLLNWLGAFEAREEFRDWTFTGWLTKGDMLEVRPGDDTLKMGRFSGGQVGAGEGGPQNLPGIAIEHLRMEQIHHGLSENAAGRLLFGDLQPESQVSNLQQATLQSAAPLRDLHRLLLSFAERAFRRPVQPSEITDYVALAEEQLQQNGSLLDAIRVGYRSLLCSPRFLYFTATPGRLDSWATATRLSYFLWNRPPDQQLAELAADDKLQDPAVVREQLHRMLAHPHGQNFIPDFAAEWLDLRDIDFTSPDRRLYPGFDVIVQHSMVAETESFLQQMLDHNQSVVRLIAADETWLNERLARYYGIAGVFGDQLQPVSLAETARPGGLMTHGAIMKITANGTTTSPVLRGVWISERLLGREIPPPPANVPAIEPDIRGATSIRDMLERHKSDSACSTCHRHIDAPGFALENFDPSGRWRSTYGIDSRNTDTAQIDASYQLASGESFGNLQEFQQLIRDRPEQIAAGMTRMLMEYATGAAVTFSERDEVERIVATVSADNYGVRSILEEIVTSWVFLNR